MSQEKINETELKNEELEDDLLSSFAAQEETFEETTAREAEENSFSTSIPRFSLPKAGEVDVRILPLKPGSKQAGWAYQLRRLFMKINVVDANGKQKLKKDGGRAVMQVPVIRVGQAFPGLKDPIDTFRSLLKSEAEAQGNTGLVELIKKNSFEGGLGLNFDARSVALLYELESQKEGIKMIELSYSQYKSLLEARDTAWKKLQKYDKDCLSPLSSMQNARTTTIIGKTENKKVSYSFVVSSDDRELQELTLDWAKALVALPDLHDVLYVYNRYHYTATLAFLKQLDAEYGYAILERDEMIEVLNAVEAALPKSDTTVFEMKVKDADNTGDDASDDEPAGYDIDSLEALIMASQDAGVVDKSPEGLKVRAAMKQFIIDNELEVVYNRTTTNEALWLALVDAFDEVEGGAGDDEPEDNAPEPEPEPEPTPEPEPEEDEAPPTRSTRATRAGATGRPGVRRRG